MVKIFSSDMATQTTMVKISSGHQRPEKVFTLVVSVAMSNDKIITL